MLLKGFFQALLALYNLVELASAALDIATQVGFPEWVEVNEKTMEGVLKALPEREEILPDINENLVVELYSKIS